MLPTQEIVYYLIIKGGSVICVSTRVFKKIRQQALVCELLYSNIDLCMTHKKTFVHMFLPSHHINLSIYSTVTARREGSRCQAVLARKQQRSARKLPSVANRLPSAPSGVRRIGNHLMRGLDCVVPVLYTK
jgi:hypothetical protein